MCDLKQQAADLFGVHLTPGQAAAFDTYLQELTAWNAHMNLTAIIAPEAVRVRHFLDSLSVAQVVTPEDGLRLLDVGAGAGFPGLALAIAFPGLHVTLLESTGKKVNFLRHVIQVLGLSNVVTVNARAEDAGQESIHRAKYDVVVARAVARLPALLEYLLPFAREGGRCVAMKGETAHDELRDSARALRVLGGQAQKTHSVQLPGVDETHYLITVLKTGKTPPQYPRRAGIPSRQPLT